MVAFMIPYATEKEWHELRRQDITASTIAGHFGHSRWSSEYSDFCAKKGLLQGPDPENDAMRAGRYAEPGIASWIADAHGWNVMTMADYAPLVSSIPRPDDERLMGLYLRDPVLRLGATPDRIIVGGLGPDEPECPLEVKHLSWWSYKDEWIDGEAPVKYWLQGLIQCGLGREAGRPWHNFRIGYGINFFEIAVKTYPFDPDAWAMVCEHATRFWKLIDSGQEPGADVTDKATREAIARRYLKSKPATIDLSGDGTAQEMVRDLWKVRESRKALEKREAELIAAIRPRMGEAEIADLGDGWVVNAKTQTRKSYTVKESTFRPIRVTSPFMTKPEEE